jgi:membrane-anchored protein YejM (alkaline phosphatase superfamily)
MLNSYNANANNNNLIIVTIDGLRWQEVFTGADNTLINNNKFVKNTAQLKEKFWDDSPLKRKKLLMPFLWNTIAKKGVLIGNRSIGSNMSVSNNWRFSYPGYSEIFTGVTDNSINSNKKIPNKNISFIEWLNNKESNKNNNLAAFGSWDVFPYIFNTQRSKLHVNAGFMPAQGYRLSAQIKLLNQLQTEIPTPWHNVRFDSFTHRFALNYLQEVKPRVMSISYGETDDFAHDGHYDQYLLSASKTDLFIKQLWQTIQSSTHYKNNTTLLITTDHGRGNTEKDWQHHASKKAIQEYMKDLNQFPEGIEGSEHIWFAAIGPNIKAQGQIKTTTEIKQNQIAATALRLLGEDPQNFNPNAGPSIKELF